jgi:superoxide reductase
VISIMKNSDTAVSAPRAIRGASTRIKNSTKPKFANPQPLFYRCTHCQRLVIDEVHGQASQPLSCCGEPMAELVAGDETSPLFAQHQPLIEVSGGFDANVATVTIGEPLHEMLANHHIEWVYLYSFQGGQVKFISHQKQAQITFALSDEDAYVYCDREVCRGSRCKFNCKRGFTAYVYCSQHGFWKKSL